MAIDKKHILEEIKRTAAGNGGVPLGRQRFLAEMGIKQSDWCGLHWIRWNDALREAGFEAIEFTKAFDLESLIEQYANLALEVGRIPLNADLRMKARNDPGFPSHTVFANRLGKKSERIRQLMEFCRKHDGYSEVVRLCEQHELIAARREMTEQGLSQTVKGTEIGFVYPMKSGYRYKIGHSNSAGRREYELAIQLPEKLMTVHVIRTDDPPGIEEYWHKRFKEKRKNGAWFELNAVDIAAFKRRKSM
jgi:hypothetical protein